MRTEPVLLRHLRTSPAVHVSLSEPTGRDELAVDGVDTRSAVALLARLLADSPVEAAALTAADRDALLAALHRHCWDDRIVATLTCTACARPFDLSFELSAVQRHLAAPDSGWRAAGQGRVTRADGRSFLVPQGRDEIAAGALGRDTAVAALLVAAEVASEDIDLASAALDAAAPFLDIDLDAECAECGHQQRAHFDLQSYLLQRVLNERDALFGEVHVLASVYGWSLDDILTLPRATRRSFAAIAGESLRRQHASERRGARA
jgi:hypothetical protein